MKITEEEVIHEVIEMVIIEMIIIGKMIRMPGTEKIEAPATIEAETTLIQEDPRTDLGTIREITHAREIPLDNPGAETEITLGHPETETKDPYQEDVIGDIEIKDLILEKEEASIEAETEMTIMGDQEIADLPPETMQEMTGVREDTHQNLNRLHHIGIGSQTSLL